MWAWEVESDSSECSNALEDEDLLSIYQLSLKSTKQARIAIRNRNARALQARRARARPRERTERAGRRSNSRSPRPRKPRSAEEVAAVLPEEPLVLDAIFHALTGNMADLLAAGSVSKAWAHAMQSNELWREACFRRWPALAVTKRAIRDCRDFARRLSSPHAAFPSATKRLHELADASTAFRKLAKGEHPERAIFETRRLREGRRGPVHRDFYFLLQLSGFPLLALHGIERPEWSSELHAVLVPELSDEAVARAGGLDAELFDRCTPGSAGWTNPAVSLHVLRKCDGRVLELGCFDHTLRMPNGQDGDFRGDGLNVEYEPDLGDDMYCVNAISTAPVFSSSCTLSYSLADSQLARYGAPTNWRVRARPPNVVRAYRLHAKGELDLKIRLEFERCRSRELMEADEFLCALDWLLDNPAKRVPAAQRAPRRARAPRTRAAARLLRASPPPASSSEDEDEEAAEAGAAAGVAAPPGAAAPAPRAAAEAAPAGADAEGTEEPWEMPETVEELMAQTRAFFGDVSRLTRYELADKILDVMREAWEAGMIDMDEEEAEAMMDTMRATITSASAERMSSMYAMLEAPPQEHLHGMLQVSRAINSGRMSEFQASHLAAQLLRADVRANGGAAEREDAPAAAAEAGEEVDGADEGDEPVPGDSDDGSGDSESADCSDTDDGGGSSHDDESL